MSDQCEAGWYRKNQAKGGLCLHRIGYKFLSWSAHASKKAFNLLVQIKKPTCESFLVVPPNSPK